MTKKEERSVMALYKAVERYVKAKGGSLACIGGVQIIQFPTDRDVTKRAKTAERELAELREDYAVLRERWMDKVIAFDHLQHDRDRLAETVTQQDHAIGPLRERAETAERELAEAQAEIFRRDQIIEAAERTLSRVREAAKDFSLGQAVYAMTICRAESGSYEWDKHIKTIAELRELLKEPEERK